MKNLYVANITICPFIEHNSTHVTPKYFLADNIMSVVERKEFDIYENQEIQPGHPNPKYFKIYKTSREFVEFYKIEYEEI